MNYKNFNFRITKICPKVFNTEKGMKDRPSYYQKISCASLLVQLWGPKPLFLTIFGQKVD